MSLFHPKIRGSLRYSIAIYFSLLQEAKKRNNFFMITFGNNFVTTLMYVKLPPPRSVLIFQSFHHPQLTYFATPLKKWGGKLWKVCQKRSIRYWPLALSMKEKFWKICKDIRQLPKEYFKKLAEKEIMSSVPQTTHPPVIWDYAIAILCTILCEIIKNNF